ncbi:sulfite exporter TauE/SafE family protein [Laribacter hongkongensis]|uniref:sulfite exporter TauE/SafE family protein n=1 Tax=Laribacter hongkongensis TaxID=168471 RepID=UPI001EFDFF31|nr:sulfite exporter TauE/SafE family protein [Laribacter hongkongensis]MCG8995585.1 sulfite exporter TauE/SafE family protein [Laribacter hongkongensis]MCG9009317.1 sulfite exporter TauE/SafE family protein [Laribacter hongkongensis]MCG9022656.1 sulfite exporter TauE/SafE family protein [Laribacter hongkongensis]MCG9045603.1 sulfite exporter TauE/SafE family protein [Laribacter hongkongensis]MCG9075029.1 sulfite exporter TauE/SafE family protein [Laribacter hongkongensis]
MLMHLAWTDFAIIFLTIVSAYIVFGIAGFGTSLVASPVLALFLPVAKIVPLLALMDMCAALGNVIKDGDKAELSELKRLVPLMMVGSGIGAMLLLRTKPETMLLGLGIFIVCYALYALSGLKPHGSFSPVASIPFGLVGGVFSALFGMGGFVYAIYLSGRIEKKEHLRVTQSSLIGLATLTRATLFALAGVYMDTTLLLLTLGLMPAMLAGMIAGRRITIGLSREQFLRILQLITLASGLMLLGRYFAHTAA